jgi:hypothetical protein
VDLALLDCYDPRRRDVAWTLVQTAQPHDAPPLDRRPAVPGIGTMLRFGLLDAMHNRTRFPRVQDGVASCRLVTCAQAAAGHRSGPAGAHMGQSSLQWACSAAAVLLLRHQPVGQQDLARVEQKQGTSTAWTVFAHPRARAVSDL